MMYTGDRQRPEVPLAPLGKQGNLEPAQGGSVMAGKDKALSVRKDK
jgi:hypothetical protein